MGGWRGVVWLMLPLCGCGVAGRELIERDLAGLRVGRPREVVVFAGGDNAGVPSCVRAGALSSGVAGGGGGAHRLPTAERRYRGALLAGIGLVAAAAGGGLIVEDMAGARRRRALAAPTEDGEDRPLLRVAVATPGGAHILRGAILGGPGEVLPSEQTFSLVNQLPVLDSVAERTPLRPAVRRMAYLTLRY